MKSAGFNGFTMGTIEFFRELSHHNTKQWFEAHRDEYETNVLAPARLFVTAMGARLEKAFPGINADPRTDRSIFRIHRDTRFSRDKSPYKTHLALWFWEGSRPRMECSGFYLHVEEGMMMVGAGIYIFPKDLLSAYRGAAGGEKSGAELRRAVRAVTADGDISIGGRFYKKTPAGFPADHPNADLLLHNGLYTGSEGPVPREILSADLVEFCFTRFKKMAPLHKWLVKLTEGGF